MSRLIARKAPDFTAAAVLGNGEITDKFHLYSALKGKYGVVFFYPMDFTFVCPTELIAFDHRYSEFSERHVELIAVSIDSQFTHHAWRSTPLNKGGIGPVQYTMVADVDHSIAQAYEVEHPEARVAVRGAFLIGKDSVVRAALINDLPLGRNVDEMLRLVDALQYYDKHGEVCPAGWNKGDKAMKATPEGVTSYLSDHGDSL
ncbi:MAG: peroxiredoxin [Gammaproteobacteria bacterium]